MTFTFLFTGILWTKSMDPEASNTAKTPFSDRDRGCRVIVGDQPFCELICENSRGMELLGHLGAGV